MYDKIRQLRAMVLKEMASESGGPLTVEHLKLAEMRVQTILMAKLTVDDLKKDEPNWKKT